MPIFSDDASPWDLSPVIGLLHTLSPYNSVDDGTETTYKISVPTPLDARTSTVDDNIELGNFNKIFDYLRNSSPKSTAVSYGTDALGSSPEKSVRWRDEAEAADLEDNVDESTAAANRRTRDRAARRAKAKAKKQSELAAQENGPIERPPVETDTGSGEDSDTEIPLSPAQIAANRKVIIQKLLHPTQDAPVANGHKSVATDANNVATPKKEWPTSHPYTFTPITRHFRKPDILPLDDLSSEARRRKLVQQLSSRFPNEKKYLTNQGVISPGFGIHNVAPGGIHVFVDISNIIIGLHDRLKLARDISLDQKIHRVPLDFFNFSLVLERGRPAAKRVLVGSDRFPHIDQARGLGYETNILERVHKAKALKENKRSPAKNGNTTSGGASSGSETNAMGPAKWVEQAVDEILHLKILESVVDAEQPGTIVLATGDAAIAEYSGGFLRMVERALNKGWTVELLSFSRGLSGLYKSYKFRNQWGPLFKIIELDAFAESLLDVDTIRAAL